MKWLVCAVLGVLALGASTVAVADEADPTGTWKWTTTFGDQTREQTLKLKLEGDKLTGVMLGRNNQEIEIENAKYSAGEVTFTVTRERNGQKVTMKYVGKVTGDVIKGKIETEREGQTQSRDWEAKRAPA